MEALLTVKDLARILGRAEKTIRNDLVRSPGRVPPRLKLDGIRQLRWKRETVEAWLNGELKAEIVEAEKPRKRGRPAKPKTTKGLIPIESLPLF